MNPRIKFAVALTACSLIVAASAAALLVALWSRLNPEQEALLAAGLAEGVAPLVFLSLLLVAGLALLLHALFRSYVLEPRRMTEDIQLMLTANPHHRIAGTGPAELAELGRAINALADHCEILQRDVDHRITEAGGALEGEKSRLAAVMSQLSESVIVCNTVGAILLYNQRAQWLLGPSPDDARQQEHDLVGLGRSLFILLGPDVVSHARDHILHRLQEGDHHPVSVFVAKTRGGRLLRARMAPVMAPVAAAGGAVEVSGYVLVLENVRRELEMAGLRDQLLTSLVENARASLAGIRAAAENLLEHPQVDARQGRQFLQIVVAEAEKLGARLDRVASDHPDSGWALPTMSGRDLLLALQREFEDRLGFVFTLGSNDEPLWIRVDSYLLVQALAGFAARLREGYGVRAFELRLQRAGLRPQLDLAWRGAVPDTETVLAWISQPLAASYLPESLSLSAVIERHGGEAWYKPDPASSTAYLRVLLAPAEHDAPLAPAPDIPSRPIFYDFDLFHRSGQTPEFDDRPLAELVYTVFDTETTGLEPSRGDEIISIGAVRIVNGRLLSGEAFDQLVNPRRPLPAESVRVHGIAHGMLAGQPEIDYVLPAFHRFCEDTVLVAHNAAFDMRFLQLKEERTGVRFANPVLDTLMLSAVLHPSQTDHSLEALAARFGVDVIGRHTALGDAIVTGAIFLKMLPLLKEQGILTLRQALDASRRTHYAGVRY